MSTQSKLFTFMLLANFGGFAVVPAQAQDYDLAILNGRVASSTPLRPSTTSS
jgi:hypothetical protein